MESYFDESVINSEVELISPSLQQQERIIFKMKIEMRKLLFQLNYETHDLETLA